MPWRQAQWFDNGNKRAEGHFASGHQNGIEIQYYKNGNKKLVGLWKDGKLNGLETQWYKNKIKKSEILYVDGQASIDQKFWGEDGAVLENFNINDFIKRNKFLH